MKAITELHWLGKSSPFSHKYRNTRKKDDPEGSTYLNKAKNRNRFVLDFADCVKGNAAYLQMLEDFGINNH